MTHDFDDSISDLLDAPMKVLPVKAGDFVPLTERVFTENCQACGGSGFWKGIRRCFKCEGSGKLIFKTSHEHRAKATAGRQQKKTDALVAFVEEHKAEVEWIGQAARKNNERGGNFTFPAAMQEAITKWGSLTDGQLAAVRKCMARDAARQEAFEVHKATVVANAPAVSTNKLVDAFAKANAKAARPGQVGVWVKPISMKSGDVALKFSNGTNQWAGMIFVKTNEDKKVGHIKDGKFVRKFTCTEAEEAAVVDCCNNPEKAAIAFGKSFGCCAICHRTLTNDGSIERGIGPICAEKFGW